MPTSARSTVSATWMLGASALSAELARCSAEGFATAREGAPARNAASSAMAEPASAAASKSTALDRASSDRRRGAKMSRLMSRANMCAVVRSSELVYMSDPSLVAGGEPPKPTSPPVLGYAAPKNSSGSPSASVLKSPPELARGMPSSSSSSSRGFRDDASLVRLDALFPARVSERNRENSASGSRPSSLMRARAAPRDPTLTESRRFWILALSASRFASRFAARLKVSGFFPNLPQPLPSSPGR
mmetsp:Transcript_10840/g.46187  ORF Transcript_10840/g.46187 Transcript_10840/m.46187 type:complete len:245 (+) Transcript_10840:265-999(+)